MTLQHHFYTSLSSHRTSPRCSMALHAAMSKAIWQSSAVLSGGDGPRKWGSDRVTEPFPA